MLPDAVRAVAMGGAIVVFWLTNFATAQSVETLLDVLSPQRTFALFGLSCVAALTFVQYCLPETKGALAATEAHSPPASPAGSRGPRVGPPTCHALMGDADADCPAVRRSRASESPSVDSDDAEWSGAVRNSVDPHTNRPLAMH